MNKPRPEDFGLNEKQTAYFKTLAASLKKEDDERFRNIMLWSIGGVGGVTFLYLIESGSFLGALFGSAFIGGLLGCILGLIINGVTLCFNSGRRDQLIKYEEAQKNYERAQKEYEAWQIRIQGQFWRSLTGRQFEHEIAQLFSQIGHQVHVTPASGDEGIDVVLEKDGRKIIVQCKAHQNPVGPSVVRELYGAMMHANANEAILVALGGFTQGVVGFVKGKPIRLMSLPDILALADSPILGKDAASYLVLSPDAKARVLQTLKKEVASGNLRPAGEDLKVMAPPLDKEARSTSILSRQEWGIVIPLLMGLAVIGLGIFLPMAWLWPIMGLAGVCAFIGLWHLLRWLR
jgi:hypothetical protein